MLTIVQRVLTSANECQRVEKTVQIEHTMTPALDPKQRKMTKNTKNIKKNLKGSALPADPKIQ